MPLHKISPSTINTAAASGQYTQSQIAHMQSTMHSSNTSDSVYHRQVQENLQNTVPGYNKNADPTYRQNCAVIHNSKPSNYPSK